MPTLAKPVAHYKLPSIVRPFARNRPAMSDTATAPLPLKMARLRGMMFMEYAVRGLWFPLAAKFLMADVSEGGLGFSREQMSYTLGIALALGAITSPFVAGQIADRWFPTQRFMGVLLILGGITKFATGYQTSYEAWLTLSIIYAVLFMPTLGLSNSLAMAHLTDAKRQFPGVRVWGTIGWIVVSWLFPMIWLKSNISFQWLPPFFTGDDVPQLAGRMLDSVKAAGVLAILYGLYSWFLLPHTPPKRSTNELALGRALKVFSKGSMAVLALATLIVSSVHFIYFLETPTFLGVAGLGGAYIMPTMSIGQFAEIGMMAMLGWLLKSQGFRRVLMIGACCYAGRYLIFGLHEYLGLQVIIASQALHGPCFACFYAAAFIYIDRMSPEDVRHSTQTLFALICFGIGPLASSQLNIALGAFCEVGSGDTATVDYSKFWLITSAITLIGVGLLAMLFKDETQNDSEASSTATNLETPAEEI